MLILRFEVDSIRIPLFNLMAVLNESDLYPLWFPFCERSIEMGQMQRVRKMVKSEFFVPFPFNNRVSTVYGSGVNRFYTEGSIFIFIKSTHLIPELEEVDEFR